MLEPCAGKLASTVLRGGNRRKVITLLDLLDSIDRLKLALSHPIPPLEKVIEQTSKSRLALQRNIRLRAVLENFFLSLV